MSGLDALICRLARQFAGGRAAKGVVRLLPRRGVRIRGILQAWGRCHAGAAGGGDGIAVRLDPAVEDTGPADPRPLNRSFTLSFRRMRIDGILVKLETVLPGMPPMFVPPVTAIQFQSAYGRPGVAPGGVGLYVALMLPPRQAEPAPRPEPRPVARGLSATLFDEAARGPLRLAPAYAARGFSEGNGYLPGQVVDRSA